MREYFYPVHYSDCAIYNEPALPAGKCNCGVDKLHEISLLSISVILRILNGHAKINFNEIADDVTCEESKETRLDFLKVIKEYSKWWNEYRKEECPIRQEDKHE